MTAVNWEAIGAVGEVLGAFGVIASLAYLALQIRQNTRAIRAERYESVVNSLMELVQPLVADERLATRFQQAVEDWHAVPLEDRSRLVHVLFAEFKVFENLFYQYRQGMLAPELWEGWRRLTLTYFVRPGVRAWWEMRKAAFSDEFREFLESAAPDPTLLPTPWAIARRVAEAPVPPEAEPPDV